MITIGSIARWQHLGTFKSVHKILDRLEPEEARALNANEEARKKVYKLVDKLHGTRGKNRESTEFRSIPHRIQFVLYFAVFDYEWKELKRELHDIIEIRKMIDRDVEEYPEKSEELALEYVMNEEKEREVRDKLRRLESDEGVKHIFD